MPDPKSETALPAAHLQHLKEQLESTGEFRVLRRFQPVGEYNPATTEPKHVAVFLDTETTGFTVGRDKIIELAMVAFEYDTEGNIYRVLRTFSQLEDPGGPLPEEVKDLTGITDEELADQRINEDAVGEFLSGARLVIAHNAAFDRPFVEARLPVFREFPWACSISDVGWRSLGFSSSGMEYLAFRHGFFFEGHRALVDSLAGVEILASQPAGSDRPTMAVLRENALQNSVRVWAEGSPFESKDALKGRRYRWSSEARSWWKDVPEELHQEELQWLVGNIYRRAVALPYLRITAKERYSTRVPTSIPANAQRL